MAGRPRSSSHRGPKRGTSTAEAAATSGGTGGRNLALRWIRGRDQDRTDGLHTGCAIPVAQPSGLDEPAPDRVAHELHAVAHAELAQDVRAMRLDGLLGEVE